MKIIIRPFIPDVDSGLVYASYAKAVYYGNPPAPNKQQWFKQFHEKVQYQLEHGQIWIACDAEDSDFTLGYCIVVNDALTFIYVKPLYRQKGIAKLLITNKFSSLDESNMTKLGRIVKDKLCN